MRTLASTTLLTALAFSPLAAHADRDGRFDDRPGLQPGGCRAGLSTTSLRRWVRNETLPLRQLLNLGNCNGLTVRQIQLTASAQDRTQAQAQLLVNGRNASYAQSIRDRYTQTYTFQLNRGQDELGRDIQTLQLALNGTVYVDHVDIVLENNPYGPRPGPGGPGPRPGPGPGPRPGPGPAPGPGPRPPYPPTPAPQPPHYAVWSISAAGGYYDTTGVIQGNHRLPEMRQYGGTLVSGEPVPMVPVLVNAMGHICNVPATAPGLGNCAAVPTHYE